MIGTYGDDAPQGRCPSPVYRESYTTARDFFNLQGAALLPIPAVAQEVLGVIHQTEDDFLNDAVTVLLRGHALVPLYLNPKYMTPRRWDALARIMAWARRNEKTLARTEVILPEQWKKQGPPEFTNDAAMPREPYGYAHWQDGRGLVLLRNPWITPAPIRVTLKNTETAGAVSLYPESRIYAMNVPPGGEIEVLLSPFETVVLEIGGEKPSEGPVDAREAVCTQLEVMSTKQKLSHVEYTCDGPRLGPDYTCLVGPSPSAARLEVEAVVDSRAERTQLLLLLEGEKTPAAPEARLEINGRPGTLERVSSDGGFSAAGISAMEHWAFYGADLPMGRSAIALKAETRAYADHVSVWVFATRKTAQDGDYSNALPSPETLYLDAKTLLDPVDIGAIREVSREPAPIERIDGVYLDTLEPVEAVQGWRKLQRNLSVWERPMSIGGRRFDRGLGTHAVSRIVFALDGAYRRFQAFAGQDDEVNGSVTFEVWVDGEKRWESGVLRRGDAAKTVDVDITGTQRLELRVGDAEDNIMADHANWADAKLIR